MNLIQAYDALGALTWDDKIAILAARLKALESQVTPPSAPVEHRFESGLYIRTMTLSTDTVFIGRKHLRGHEVHLTKGRATYITPKGKFECSAPFSIFTSPGFAMVAYIHEDCVAETWHMNIEESRDIAMLEARDFEAPELLAARGRILEDRLDYMDLTKGHDEGELFKLYGHTTDLFEEGCPPVELKDSARGGVGVFATQDLGKGDYIGIMMRAKRRTLLGRWANHGLHATGRLVRRKDEVHLFAREDIQKGDELTIDYRISVPMGGRACLAYTP